MFIIYAIIVNIAAFAMFGTDKYYAVHNKWRISEKMLLGICFIGGAVGGYIGMQIFRHKTQHNIFTIGVPAMIVLNIIFSVIIAFIPYMKYFGM